MFSNQRIDDGYATTTKSSSSFSLFSLFSIGPLYGMLMADGPFVLLRSSCSALELKH